MSKFASLKKEINPMPAFVKEALYTNDLVEDFESRPAYQQNDYIGWINRARRDDTKRKRLNQMLEELRKGGVYMKMAHPASTRKVKSE